MQRQEKEKCVQDLLLSLKKERSLFVLSHTHFKANRWISLRQAVKKYHGSVIVVKKNLAKILFKNLNYDHLMNENQKGHIFLVTAGSDFFKVLNILKKFTETKEKNISLLGGVLEKNVLNQSQLNMVSQMNSVNDIRVALIRILLYAPMKLIRVLKEAVKIKETS